ncbi:invasion associated locus B family protein [Yoonia sp. R2-816]|uniref:invasion associated locus B family protein n=1 Tax=Yoonia sp. R2-816 TaxID=3342638 RepID=UPI0037298499
MSSFFKSIILAGLLTQAGAAIAQETETETPAEENAPAQDGAPDDLILGEPLPPKVGEPYVLQEFGDWEMRCVKAPEGQNDPCNLYQLLLDNDGNQVAEVNLFRLPDGSRAAAGATIVVPLETLLTQQLTLSVDGGEARRYPFTFCNAAGCVSRLGFTQAEVDQFKRGSNATLRLVPAAAPDQEVLLTMSLTGFTAGFEGVVTLE